MSTKEELKKAFQARIKDASQAQLRWVKALKIDWEEKTMTAMGVSDALEYYDIQLGTGSIFLKPKPDTTCLIGIIEGQEAAAFLLSAMEVEEITVDAETLISFNGGKLGGLVKVEALTNKLNELIDTFNKHTHTIPSGGISTQGSATAQSTVAPVTVPAIDKKQEKVKREDYENEKIKQ